MSHLCVLEEAELKFARLKKTTLLKSLMAGTLLSGRQRGAIPVKGLQWFHGAKGLTMETEETSTDKHAQSAKRY